jgi:lipopolysaccharide export system permease protein
LNLIGRYIFRQTFVSTLIVMSVLLLIFMSNRFAETLGDAAADALPREAVFRVFGLQFLQYLALLAPIGLMLGILLALARLNRDSEMAALAAGGVGPAKLLKPIGLLSLVVAAGVGWLALVEAPAASRAIEQIRRQAQQEMELGTLEPGSFTTFESGGTVLHPRESDGGVLLGVFYHSEHDDRTIVAEAAELIENPQSGELSLILTNGTMYQGRPGELQFSIFEFGRNEWPIQVEETVYEEAIATMPTLALLGSTDPASRAELEWRIAAPLSILVLTLLAVPLGRSSPREGKYARVGLGLLLYLIYANSLSIARVWVEREIVPAWIGTWWVHAGVALLAILLLLSQSGVWARPKPVKVRLEPTD